MINNELLNSIDYNKEYDSNSGKFIFIKNTESIARDSIKINIMFKYTGYIRNVYLHLALKGNVSDPLLKYFDKEYYSGKGEPVKLLKYSHRVNGSIFVKIRYLIYEYEDIVNLYCLLNSNIKNPYYPSFHNIGCVGKPEKYLTKHIDCWHGMLSRCYNKNDRRYNGYGGIGVSVCDRWLCFEYFLQDIKLLPNYDKWLNTYNEYQLDKDVLQSNIPKNKRIYSPQTCMFISKIDNLNQKIIDNIGKSNYIGVYYNKQHSTYSAYICHNGARIYLGTYTNVEAAANAYNWYIIQNNMYKPLNKVLPMSIEEMNSYLSDYHGITKCIDYRILASKC